MAELGMKFDDVLRNLTGQAGSLEALLGVFFSFLHRNTDFYVTFDPAKTARPGMGFPPGKAEQLLLRAFNSLPYKQYGGQQQPQTENGRGAGRGAAATAAAPVSGSSGEAAPSTSRAFGRGSKPMAAPASHTPEAMDRSSSKTGAEVVDGKSRSTAPPSPPQQQQATSGSDSKGPESSSNAACGEGAGPSSSTPTASSPQAVTFAATTAASESNSIRVRYTDSGKQVPIGNGGVTPKYYWTQTVSEATVYIDVPPGTHSKDVSCLIQPRRLKLRVRGAGAAAISAAAATVTSAPGTAPAEAAAAPAAAKGLTGATPEDGDVIIDGELPSAVSRDGSMWSLNDGNTVVISFEKATRSWWKSVVEGDPEIDTSKVDSTSKISEYDDETQSTIRKIMFDQRQKALGLPTSDQISSESLLEKAKGLPGSPFLPGGALFSGGSNGGDRSAAAAAAAAAVPAQNASDPS